MCRTQKLQTFIAMFIQGHSSRGSWSLVKCCEIYSLHMKFRDIMCNSSLNPSVKTLWVAPAVLPCGGGNWGAGIPQLMPGHPNILETSLGLQPKQGGDVGNRAPCTDSSTEKMGLCNLVLVTFITVIPGLTLASKYAKYFL